MLFRYSFENSSRSVKNTGRDNVGKKRRRSIGADGKQAINDTDSDVNNLLFFVDKTRYTVI